MLLRARGVWGTTRFPQAAPHDVGSFDVVTGRDGFSRTSSFFLEPPHSLRSLRGLVDLFLLQESPRSPDTPFQNW